MANHRQIQPSSEAIAQIVERYGLRLLVYFGSYQTEFYRADSDIDIAYLAMETLAPMTRMALHEDLILAHRKGEIDLVDLQTAEPILRYEIARNGRVLFEQEEGLFVRYALFYIKQMYELRPVIQERMRLLTKEIKELNSDG